MTSKFLSLFHCCLLSRTHFLRKLTCSVSALPDFHLCVPSFLSMWSLLPCPHVFFQTPVKLICEWRYTLKMAGIVHLYIGIHVMIVEMFTRGAFQVLLIANLQPKNLPLPLPYFLSHLAPTVIVLIKIFSFTVYLVKDLSTRDGCLKRENEFTLRMWPIKTGSRSWIFQALKIHRQKEGRDRERTRSKVMGVGFDKNTFYIL